MRHKKEWTPFAGKVSNRQRPVRFRSKKCDFQNETITNNLSKGQIKLHSKTGKSTYFYKQRWFTYLIPSLSTLALLLVLGFSINPISTQNNHQAFAETNASAQSNDIVPENGVALRIDTTLNDKDTIEEQVTSTGTQYIKVDFTVGANNIQNYDVYVQADSTALTGQAHGDKLQSITTNSTGTVGTKEWGYGVSRGSVDPSTMTYRPIQTSVSTSADGQDAGEGNALTGISQPYTLAFAANLEGAASDHYKSNITLSVAAGATETTKTGLGFNGITEMQQMTSSICNSATPGLEGRLKDTRDNKVYWISKLPDNKCWMTQNLDLNLNTSTILTSAKSDVTNWRPAYNTQTTPSGWGATGYGYLSYDPGNYYRTTPRAWYTCGENGSSAGLSYCTESGWKENATNADIDTLIDVTGWSTTDDWYFVQSTNYTGTDGKSICNKEAGSMIGDSKYSQCRIYYYTYSYAYEHYHSGNYYGYATATADTAPSSEGEAFGSICPKGWKLPTGEKNTGELYILLTGKSSQTFSIYPYYFIGSGGISNNVISGAGNMGYYWTSTVSSNNNYPFAAWLSGGGAAASNSEL